MKYERTKNRRQRKERIFLFLGANQKLTFFSLKDFKETIKYIQQPQHRHV